MMLAWFCTVGKDLFLKKKKASHFNTTGPFRESQNPLQTIVRRPPHHSPVTKPPLKCMFCLINIYSEELKNKVFKGLEKDSTKEGKYRVERNGFNLVQGVSLKAKIKNFYSWNRGNLILRICRQICIIFYSCVSQRNALFIEIRKVFC